jgi:translation elongation factor EF-Tu-like GTPase
LLRGGAGDGSAPTTFEHVHAKLLAKDVGVDVKMLNKAQLSDAGPPLPMS